MDESIVCTCSDSHLESIRLRVHHGMVHVVRVMKNLVASNIISCTVGGQKVWCFWFCSGRNFKFAHFEIL